MIYEVYFEMLVLTPDSFPLPCLVFQSNTMAGFNFAEIKIKWVDVVSKCQM